MGPAPMLRDDQSIMSVGRNSLYELQASFFSTAVPTNVPTLGVIGEGISSRSNPILAFYLDDHKEYCLNTSSKFITFFKSEASNRKGSTSFAINSISSDSIFCNTTSSKDSADDTDNF